MISTLIGIGIVVLQVAIVGTVIFILSDKNVQYKLSTYSNVILRIVATGAVLGSLFYSEILHFDACLLCWWQRIFIFGIAILSWTGDIRKSKLLRTQIIIFSIIGLCFAVFHNIIDIFPTGLDVCGAGPSCLKRYVDFFGYITIPMMSLTILAGTLLLGLISKGYPQTDFANEIK